MALSKQDREEIIQIIQLTVNGKIDRLAVSFEQHKVEMDPIVEGWRTVKNGRNFLLWVGATLAAAGATAVFIKNNFL